MTDQTSIPHPPAVTTRLDTNDLRTLRTLSKVVAALVCIVAALHLGSLPNEIAYIGSLQDLADGDLAKLSDIEAQEDLRAAFGMITIGAAILTGIVWVVWQQRARRIAEQLGASGQRHSKGMAAFGWFIPIANLFIPKQVTDDLWRASDPDGPAAMNISGRPVWSGVHQWWAAWMLGGILARILLRTDEPASLDELDGYITSVRIGLAAPLLVMASAIPAVLIIQRITARLAERAARLSRGL